MMMGLIQDKKDCIKAASYVHQLQEKHMLRSPGQQLEVKNLVVQNCIIH